MKKILILSTRDSQGGAFEWIYNFAKILSNEEFNVALVVAEKKKNDNFIFQVPIIKYKKSLIKRGVNFSLRLVGLNRNKDFTTKPEYSFFPGEDQTKNYISSDSILSAISFVPEIIIVGLTYQFVNFVTLLELSKRTGAKIFFTLLDMGVLTGGCHVVNECEGFESNCENCPGIIEGNPIYTVNNLNEKMRCVKEGKFGLMYGSSWGKFQVDKSTVFKDSLKLNIGNCVDTNLYTNVNRDIAKKIFNLQRFNKVIFAGADNMKEKRKGQKYLINALSELYNRLTESERESIVVMVAGNYISQDGIASRIPFQTHLINFIHDTRLLSLAYQASSVFVNSSTEDLGPAMVGEALACGTPVIGFEMGLLFDNSIVINKMNGYRAKIKDSYDLANGIEYFMKMSEEEFNKASDLARKRIIEKASEKKLVSTLNEI